MKTKTSTKTIKKNDDEQQQNSSLTSCPLDFGVCREALIALKKLIINAQHGHKQLLDESTPISLYIHVHKIPRCTYFRLNVELPHPLPQYQTREICLFVRDDDINGREYDKTIRRYKSMIDQFQLPFSIDIMTLKQLNQELIPYEAKRKLCSRYDLFLADRRILTSLMRGQLLGKHFRHHNKMPLGINLFNKDLKQRLITLCSSTYGRLSGTGPLFSIQFTTIQQTIDYGLENLQIVCDTIEKQLPGNWFNVHHAYLYGNNLQSLPIYYSTHTKNDVKQINEPSINQTSTTIGELSTINSNLNVIVGSTGNIRLTRKSELTKLKKKKSSTSLKRLQNTWLKNSTKSKKPSKKQKKIQDIETILDKNDHQSSFIDTPFIQRIKKNKKLKHIEQDFARKPAPRAEKRKQLLAARKNDENNK